MNKYDRIKQLFTLVKEGGSLASVFKKLSLKWGLSENSIRNFYYTEYKNLMDKDYANKVGVSIEGIKKLTFNTFATDDKESLIKSVLEASANGESVRATCLRLSGGDANKMIRLQNKYRSTMKNEPEFVQEVVKKYNIKTTDNKENVLTIRRKARLSDSDINSLFMGLVRLIKNNSISEVSEVLKKECNIAHKNLNETRAELKLVVHKLEEEKRKNKKLQSEIDVLMDNSKMEEFRKYLSALKINVKNENQD